MRKFRELLDAGKKIREIGWADWKKTESLSWFALWAQSLSPDEMDANIDSQLLPRFIRRIYRRLQSEPQRQTGAVPQ